MTYADFTYGELETRFGVAVRPKRLSADVAPLDPGPWLKETLERAWRVSLPNETAKSETVVEPVLNRCGDFLQPNFTIYSGLALDADAAAGLKGECDFMIARLPPIAELRSPLMVLVEAENHDIERGLNQCAAQMVGARKFNEARGLGHLTIHGCSTTADGWQFLKLDGIDLWYDTVRYYLPDIGKILGIIVSALKEYDPL